MPFPFKIGDKVVYRHPFSELNMRRWPCEPVERIENDYVYAFCPAIERVTNPVQVRFFELSTLLLYALYEINVDGLSYDPT